MQHHRLMAGHTQGAEHITTRTCARFPKLLKTKNQRKKITALRKCERRKHAGVCATAQSR